MPGRPRKYPINTLDVGQEMLIPWLVLPNGQRHPTQKPIYNAIHQEQRRFSKQFAWQPTPHGVIVRRVR